MSVDKGETVQIRSEKELKCLLKDSDFAKYIEDHNALICYASTQAKIRNLTAVQGENKYGKEFALVTVIMDDGKVMTLPSIGVILLNFEESYESSLGIDLITEDNLVRTMAAESIQAAFRRYRECKEEIKKRKIQSSQNLVLNLASETISRGLKRALSGSRSRFSQGSATTLSINADQGSSLSLKRRNDTILLVVNEITVDNVPNVNWKAENNLYCLFQTSNWLHRTETKYGTGKKASWHDQPLFSIPLVGVTEDTKIFCQVYHQNMAVKDKEIGKIDIKLCDQIDVFRLEAVERKGLPVDPSDFGALNITLQLQSCSEERKDRGKTVGTICLQCNIDRGLPTKSMENEEIKRKLSKVSSYEEKLESFSLGSSSNLFPHGGKKNSDRHTSRQLRDAANTLQNFEDHGMTSTNNKDAEITPEKENLVKTPSSKLGIAVENFPNGHRMSRSTSGRMRRSIRGTRASFMSATSASSAWADTINTKNPETPSIKSKSTAAKKTPGRFDPLRLRGPRVFDEAFRTALKRQSSILRLTFWEFALVLDALDLPVKPEILSTANNSISSALTGASHDPWGNSSKQETPGVSEFGNSSTMNSSFSDRNVGRHRSKGASLSGPAVGAVGTTVELPIIHAASLAATVSFLMRDREMLQEQAQFQCELSEEEADNALRHLVSLIEGSYGEVREYVLKQCKGGAVNPEFQLAMSAGFSVGSAAMGPPTGLRPSQWTAELIQRLMLVMKLPQEPFQDTNGKNFLSIERSVYSSEFDIHASLLQARLAVYQHTLVLLEQWWDEGLRPSDLLDPTLKSSASGGYKLRSSSVGSSTRKSFSEQSQANEASIPWGQVDFTLRDEESWVEISEYLNLLQTLVPLNRAYGWGCVLESLAQYSNSIEKLRGLLHKDLKHSRVSVSSSHCFEVMQPLVDKRIGAWVKLTPSKSDSVKTHVREILPMIRLKQLEPVALSGSCEGEEVLLVFCPVSCLRNSISSGPTGPPGVGVKGLINVNRLSEDEVIVGGRAMVVEEKLLTRLVERFSWWDRPPPAALKQMAGKRVEIVSTNELATMQRVGVKVEGMNVLDAVPLEALLRCPDADTKVKTRERESEESKVRLKKVMKKVQKNSRKARKSFSKTAPKPQPPMHMNPTEKPPLAATTTPKLTPRRLVVPTPHRAEPHVPVMPLKNISDDEVSDPVAISAEKEKKEEDMFENVFAGDESAPPPEVPVYSMKKNKRKKSKQQKEEVEDLELNSLEGTVSEAKETGNGLNMSDYAWLNPKPFIPDQENIQPPIQPDNISVAVSKSSEHTTRRRHEEKEVPTAAPSSPLKTTLLQFDTAHAQYCEGIHHNKRATNGSGKPGETRGNNQVEDHDEREFLDPLGKPINFAANPFRHAKKIRPTSAPSTRKKGIYLEKDGVTYTADVEKIDPDQIPSLGPAAEFGLSGVGYANSGGLKPGTNSWGNDMEDKKDKSVRPETQQSKAKRKASNLFQFNERTLDVSEDNKMSINGSNKPNYEDLIEKNESPVTPTSLLKDQKVEKIKKKKQKPKKTQTLANFMNDKPIPPESPMSSPSFGVTVTHFGSPSQPKTTVIEEKNTSNHQKKGKIRTDREAKLLYQENKRTEKEANLKEQYLLKQLRRLETTS